MSASLYPSLPSLVLVLICSALCFIHRALRPAVIECVLSPYPRNYSLLVESNSAHAAFSTNRCRSISYRAILTWREEHISSWRVFNKHRTRHSAPFWVFFTFQPVHSLHWEPWTSVETWMSIQRKLPIWTELVFLFVVALSLCVTVRTKLLESNRNVHRSKNCECNWKSSNSSINEIKGHKLYMNIKFVYIMWIWSLV